MVVSIGEGLLMRAKVGVSGAWTKDAYHIDSQSKPSPGLILGKLIRNDLSFSGLLICGCTH